MSVTKNDVMNFLEEIHGDEWLSSNVNPIMGNDFYNCSYYREEDDAHCLVGHFMYFNMHIPHLAFSLIEENGANEAFHILMSEGFIDKDGIESEAITVLETAQMLADNYRLRKSSEGEIVVRKTWGEVAAEIIMQEDSHNG